MSVSVTMPRLGESVSEGTVTRWLKAEGDQVEADEPLLEVSTDKVDTEIPSPSAGTLTSIKVAEDETVEVGTELAIIDDGSGGGGSDAAASSEPAAEAETADDAAGGTETPEPEAEAAPEPEPEPEPEAEAAPEPEPEPEPQPVAESKPAPAAPAPAPQPASGDQGDGQGASYVTPLVRRLAAEHDVDLADVQGTGVGGRIRKQDVLDAASNGRSAAPAEAPAAPAASAPAPDTASSQIETPARQPSAPPVATTDQATKAAPDTSVRGRTE